jgi:hypothetical protein
VCPRLRWWFSQLRGYSGVWRPVTFDGIGTPQSLKSFAWVSVRRVVWARRPAGPVRVTWWIRPSWVLMARQVTPVRRPGVVAEVDEGGAAGDRLEHGVVDVHVSPRVPDDDDRAGAIGEGEELVHQPGREDVWVGLRGLGVLEEWAKPDRAGLAGDFLAGPSEGQISGSSTCEATCPVRASRFPELVGPQSECLIADVSPE